MAGGFILIIVVIKLIAPRMEEAPAKCKEKIAPLSILYQISSSINTDLLILIALTFVLVGG